MWDKECCHTPDGDVNCDYAAASGSELHSIGAATHEGEQVAGEGDRGVR